MRLLALLLLLVAAPLQAQQFPELTGRVVDAADILPPDVEQQIIARSEEIERQTTAQVVVATVPDLQGYEIEDYGYRLGRTWGIGQKREAGGKGDNGVILLVAPNERRVRIEVGYGLEPVLTDALSAVIIQSAVLPKFRAGDMPGGVLDGFDQIAKQVELPPEEAAANVQAAEARAAATGQGGGGVPIQGIIFFLFLIFWIWSVIRRAKHGKRSRRGGPIVIWGPGTGGWGGGGGGWGGGGGFGGGGGGFGGGGASGGW